MKYNMEKNNIKHVTVYSDRALVAREVKLTGLDGENIYNFENLTYHLIKNSLRVKGAGDLVLLDNNLVEVVLKDSSNENIRKLKAEIEQVMGQIKSLDRELEKYTFIKSYIDDLFIEENPDNRQGKDYEIATSVDFQKLYDFYTNETGDINEKILSLEIEKRELNKKLEKLVFDAEHLKGLSETKILNCNISYRMKSKGDAILAIFYVVTNASWLPVYDGRLLYEKREFELITYTEIHQKTGEDWDDVTLELSTASPATGAYLPEPEPWYIDFFVPPPPPAQVFAKSAMKMKKKGKKDRLEDSIEPAPEVELDFAIDDLDEAEYEEVEIAEEKEVDLFSEDTFTPSDIKTEGLNVTFTCSSKHDIPTDGTMKKVFVSIDRFPVEYEYIVKPALEEAAYLKIIMDNNREYPVLSGVVKVFRDFDYTGDSQIKTIAPGQKLELFMGIDDRIKVKRELVNRFTRKKGLGNRDLSVEYTYKLTIESFKDKKEQIKVFEQIPVSRNKEIEVKIIEQSNFNDPDERGILKMEFEINPLEKKEFLYSYSVRYPHESNVIGLA